MMPKGRRSLSLLSRMVMMSDEEKGSGAGGIVINL